MVVCDNSELLDESETFDDLSMDRLLLVTKEHLKAAQAWKCVDRKTRTTASTLVGAWQNVKYDLKQWSTLSGISETKLKRMVPTLITLRIINDDGTVPDDVGKIIESMVIKRFGFTREELTNGNS